MEYLPLIVVPFLVKSTNAIAGLLGGLTAWLLDPELTWREGVTLLIVGGVTAFYLIPALQEHWNVSAATASFIAYSVGITARTLILYGKKQFIKRAEKEIDILIDTK